MLIPKSLLLAVLAAVRLPAHVTAGPLRLTEALHDVGRACNGHDLIAGCEALPVPAVSDELAGSLGKRADVPIIDDPVVPESEPIAEPEPGVGITPSGREPIGGVSEPINWRPEPKPDPQQGSPKPEQGSPKPGQNSPKPGQGSPNPGQGSPKGKEPDDGNQPTSDDPNQPQGISKGNLPDFNGYAVQGPNKAVTKLDDAINSNKPDVQVPKFDAKLDNPLEPGQKFSKYEIHSYFPNLGAQRGGLVYKDPFTVMSIKNERFLDPDVELPISTKNADRTTLDDGGRYIRIQIRSVKKDKEGRSDDVVEMAGNRGGTVMIISKTDAEKDNNNNAASDNVPDIFKKVSSSNLLFQGAGRVRDPKVPASALKVIMRQNVNNIGTTNTLREAFQRTSLGLYAKKGVFKASAAKDTEEGRAFDALTQTKNLEVSNFMLADHHQAINDKVIQKIVAFPNKGFEDLTVEKPSVDVFLFLGPK